jgi:colicin import membrane protein
MKELALVEKMTGVQLYTEGKMQEILGKIEKEVLSIVPDVATKKGRDEVRSLAFNVSKSKTYMDKLGKESIAEAQQVVKTVNAERKTMRDTLDELKTKVRQPLTDFEENEKKIAEAITQRIYDITLLSSSMSQDEVFYTSAELVERLAMVKAVAIDDSFGEKVNEAAIEKDLAITSIEANITKRTKEEAEKAELEKLRIENEAREKREYEERIRKEATEKAEQEATQRLKDAEDKAQREKLEYEQEATRAAVEAEEKRVADTQDAQERAEREKQAILDAQKAKEQAQRVQEQEELDRLKKIKAEDDRRKQDTDHRATINRNILKALVEIGITEAKAKKVIVEMASSRIPHVSINY